MRARLCWDGAWISAPRYLDRFVWTYRDELEAMDVPEEVWTVLRLLKRGYNGAEILARAARRAHEEHPQTWQRRFAKRYVRALDDLLAGNSLATFSHRLGVELPEVDDTFLGRRNLQLG